MLARTQWLRLRSHTSRTNYKNNYRQLLAIPVLGVLLLGVSAGVTGAAGAEASTDANPQPAAECCGCEAQLHVSKPTAAKPDGDKQPLDLFVDLTDEIGKPIEGAKVWARATDFETFVDAPLTGVGNGRYMACSFGYFNGKGEGALAIHIRAEKTGYREGESDGVSTNTLGGLCTVPPRP